MAKDIGKTKKCITCGCLAVIIITSSGPICKKCLEEMYKHPDLPSRPSPNVLLDNPAYGISAITTASGLVSDFFDLGEIIK